VDTLYGHVVSPALSTPIISRHNKALANNRHMCHCRYLTRTNIIVAMAKLLLKDLRLDSQTIFKVMAVETYYVVKYCIFQIVI